jgi:hypothetical protein
MVRDFNTTPWNDDRTSCEKENSHRHKRSEHIISKPNPIDMYRTSIPNNNRINCFKYIISHLPT